MAKDRARIYVIEDGITYKASSIYTLGDGSFKVDVPYCNYEKGVVLKFATDYSNLELSRDKIIKGYFTSRRPQLSVHASGFVQFSGQGIISGIDRETGEIKGMGLHSNPLATPVFSGPTFAITYWGFKSGYEIVKTAPTGSIIYDKDTFLEKLPPNMNGNILNTFRLEGWVIPFNEINAESKIYKSDEGEMILLNLPNTPSWVIFPTRIIRLNNLPCVIALNPSFSYSNLNSKHDYGFVLSSPGEKSKEAEGFWDVMLAIYPDTSNEKYSYLDYLGEIVKI